MLMMANSPILNDSNSNDKILIDGITNVNRYKNIDDLIIELNEKLVKKLPIIISGYSD